MTAVVLKNKAMLVDAERFLQQVLENVCLPQGRILLILNDGSLAENNLGVCVARELISFSTNETVYRPYLKERWDCTVAVSNKICLLKHEYPAYFAYVLGHELGHAYVCLSDLALDIHGCLIQGFIRDASENKVKYRYQLPHEMYCDRYGVYIAEQLFSRKKLHEDIRRLLERPDCRDRSYHKFILSLSGSTEFNELRQEVVRFSIPYKDKLIALWKKDVADRGEESLASLVYDYEELFR